MTVNHTKLNILPRESHGKVTEDLNSCEGGKILAVYQNTSGSIYGGRLSAVNQNISGGRFVSCQSKHVWWHLWRQIVSCQSKHIFLWETKYGNSNSSAVFFRMGVNKCIAKVSGFVRICSVMMVYVLSAKKTFTSNIWRLLRWHVSRVI